MNKQCWIAWRPTYWASITAPQLKHGRRAGNEEAQSPQSKAMGSEENRTEDMPFECLRDVFQA